MKKKLFIAAAFIIMASAFTACKDLFQNCKLCATNTYEGSTLIIPGAEAEYCGADLLTKEATPDVTIGAQVIKTECR
jgi:hypothetical protein